jgi:hypothetical protein
MRVGGEGGWGELIEKMYGWGRWVGELIEKMYNTFSLLIPHPPTHPTFSLFIPSPPSTHPHIILYIFSINFPPPPTHPHIIHFLY